MDGQLMADLSPETLDTIKWILAGIAGVIAAFGTAVAAVLKWFANLLFSQDCDKDGQQKGLVTRLHGQALNKLDNIHFAIIPAPGTDRVEEIRDSLQLISTNILALQNEMDKTNDLLHRIASSLQEPTHNFRQATPDDTRDPNYTPPSKPR